MTASAAQKRTAPLFDPGFLSKLEYFYIISKKVLVGRLRADRRSRRVGAGLEFADHRPYSYGDDFRYVDWNLYGRMNRLLLRLFQEEEDLTVYLLVDRSASMDHGRFNKFDYALRVVAALTYVALANLDRVHVIPWSDRTAEPLSGPRGKGQIFRILRALEELAPGGPTDLAASMRDFVHRFPHKGMAVVVSDFFDPAGCEPGLKLLRHHGHETFVLQVCDVTDAHPEQLGDLRLRDRESDRERAATVTTAVLRDYERAFADFVAGLERFCLSQEIGHIRTLTDVPFEELILRVFRQGQFLH